MNFDDLDSLDKRATREFCQPMSRNVEELFDVNIDYLERSLKLTHSLNRGMLLALLVFSLGFLLVHQRVRLRRLFRNLSRGQPAMDLGLPRPPIQFLSSIEKSFTLPSLDRAALSKTTSSEPALFPDRLRSRYSKSKPLWHAATEGDLDAMNLALDGGADIDGVDPIGGNALIAASENGFAQAVKLLLYRNASLSAKGLYGSAIQSAAFKGHDTTVKALLDFGANVDTAVGEYGTPLQIATSKGHKRIVEILLDSGADINACSGTQPFALEVATLAHHEDLVKTLLSCGKTRLGSYYVIGRQQICRAIYVASCRGHHRILKLLFQSKAAILLGPIESTSALKAAAKRGCNRTVDLILDNKINHNASETTIGPALLMAASMDHNNIIEALMSRITMSKYFKEDVNEILISAARRGLDHIVTIFLDRGANINAIRDDHTALEAAAESGHQRTVLNLLERGARINPVYTEPSPLEAAAKNGHEDLVLVLLQRGAHVAARGEDPSNPLYAAALGSHESIVRILLDHNADPNAKGVCCNNALKAAIRGGNVKIVSLLLSQGADVNAGCRFCGNTLKTAKSAGNDRIVELLLDYEATQNPHSHSPIGSLNHQEFKALLSDGTQVSSSDKIVENESILVDDSCDTQTNTCLDDESEGVNQWEKFENSADHIFDMEM